MFSIGLLHITQTVICCVLVRMRLTLGSVCYFIAVVTVPVVYMIFPFLAFHIVFYQEKKYNGRRVFYLILMGIGLFVYVLGMADLIVKLVNREEI